MDFAGRQKNLKAEVQRRKLDALLVTHLPNVRYLCGFTGSAGVLLLRVGQRPLLFVDGRYTEQAQRQAVGARVVTAKGAVLIAACELCAAKSLRRIGIESDHLCVAALTTIEQTLGKGTRVVRLSGAVETLRLRKEPEEIDCIRQAVDLASKLFRPLLRELKPGRSEMDAAAKLEYLARRAGAEGMSFETIVASGERAALPHGVASRAVLPKAGFVVLDYGVVANGYCSDMTRTVHLGPVKAKWRAVYDAVLEANSAGIAAVHAGMRVCEVDRAAREVLRRAKLERYFVHSTGHGVGLEIHEQPRLGQGNDALLEPGMVVTVEPGVYLPGESGVRIEDLVVVTEQGCEVLTPVTKTLLELR